MGNSQQTWSVTRLDIELMKRQRMSLKLSQRQVGAAVGRSRIAVTHWEAGRHAPDTAVLPLLARVLGVTVDDLLASPEVGVGVGAQPAPAGADSGADGSGAPPSPPSDQRTA
jgi:transcriptional regulator with XRE-family HTH domain